MTTPHYVLFGLSSLSLSVAGELLTDAATVTLIHDGSSPELVDGLDPRIRPLLDRGDHARALAEAHVESATCLLAVSSSDLANLQVAMLAHERAPQVPVVLRTFDPLLATELEQGFNIRRAFSVSALSAPSFVAAVLADGVVENLKLSGQHVLLCQLTVTPHCPLRGLTVTEVGHRHGCQVLATATEQVAGASARSPGCVNPAPDTLLEAGMEITAGGLLMDVLHLAYRNSRLAVEPRRAPLPRPSSPPGGGRQQNFVPAAAAALLLIMTLAVVVFHRTLGLSWIDSYYFIVTTATTTGYGDISLKDAPAWIKVFGTLVMLSGASLVAVLFSYLSALLTADRLQEHLERRARKLRGHVVVSGLGNLGYRVDRLLNDLGLQSVVLERQPDSRFVDAVRKRSIVLKADARLPESLELANIANASAIVACTDDDLANIQAALQARRLNPAIYTVARIVDPYLSEHLPKAFQIDRVINPYRSVVGAFAGAARGEHAPRFFKLCDQPWTAFRYTVPRDVPAARIDEWERAGLRVLAVHAAGTPGPMPWKAGGSLSAGDVAVVSGPENTASLLVAE